MKPRIFLRLILALSALLAPSPAGGEEADTVVKETRARYTAIEKATLRSVTVKFESRDEPVSGTCKLGYLGDKLVRVALSYEIGDHGGTNEYFYYQEGKLIFAFAVDHSWRFGGRIRPDGEPGTIDTVAEHRAYFADGELIRHLERKASGEDAEAIRGLLEKASNKPSGDRERAKRLQEYGNAAFRIKTSADLAKLLLK